MRMKPTGHMHNAKGTGLSTRVSVGTDDHAVAVHAPQGAEAGAGQLPGLLPPLVLCRVFTGSQQHRQLLRNEWCMRGEGHRNSATLSSSRMAPPAGTPARWTQESAPSPPPQPTQHNHSERGRCPRRSDRNLTHRPIWHLQCNSAHQPKMQASMPTCADYGHSV